MLPSTLQKPSAFSWIIKPLVAADEVDPSEEDPLASELEVLASEDDATTDELETVTELDVITELEEIAVSDEELPIGVLEELAVGALDDTCVAELLELTTTGVVFLPLPHAAMVVVMAASSADLTKIVLAENIYNPRVVVFVLAIKTH